MASSSTSGSSSSRTWDVVLALALLLSLGGSSPYFGRLMNANERPRILQAMAWVDTAELAVDGLGARGLDPGVDVSRSPVDGRLYPNKPPGATVPAIAAYAGLRSIHALGGPQPTLRSVTLASRVLGGLLPTLVLLLVAAHRLRERGAGVVGDAAIVLLALATPLTSYARLLFGHSLAACALFCGWILLWRASEPGSRDRRGAFAGGFLAGSAIAVEYLAVFAGLPFAILLVVRWRARGDPTVLGCAVLGALVPVAALALYHHIVFGAPWATGYHHVVDQGFAQTHARGLLGLSFPTPTSLFEHLLSAWGGLLVWAPLLVAALGVGLWTWRDLDLEERLATGTFALFTLIVLGLAQTGGWRVGPRYLVLAMPFGVYALVRLLRVARNHRVASVLVVGLALASTLLNAAAANLFPHLIPHGNPWPDLLWPLLAEGRMSHAIVPHPTVALVLVLGVPLLLTTSVLRRALGLGFASLFAGLLLGFALSIAPWAWPSHPEASADLDAVRSIWEPDGPRPAPLTPLPALPE